jgi:hypothetical protein
LTKLSLNRDQAGHWALGWNWQRFILDAETGTLSQSDPTDHTLAAIASILDHPLESPRETGQVEARQGPPPIATPSPLAPSAPSAPTSNGETYSRIGPGPIAAIRFKWTARRGENGEYFVDETIGESSTPITAGPMTRDDAIRMVDEREAEARQRFEQLRHEMTGRAAAADLVRKGTGEA